MEEEDEREARARDKEEAEMLEADMMTVGDNDNDNDVRVGDKGRVGGGTHNKEMLVSCPVVADDNIAPSTEERTLIWTGDLLANPLEMSTGQISV